MKVIFAGTPEFAAIAFEAILNAGFEVPLVLTQPDRPAGRGMQLQASAVKQLALKHQISVAQPTSLRLNGKYPDIAKSAYELLNSTPHDVMVVAAYGIILPLAYLQIPRLGCINIHASLLPRWRGAAPIHRAIEAGDTHTGITIMQMDEGLDTGPMLLRQTMPIGPCDTTASLHDKLASMGGEMIISTLRQLETSKITPTVQSSDGVCYAAKISKEEAMIDFGLSADMIERKIRAFNPFPVAHAKINGTTIKFWQAQVIEAKKHPITAPINNCFSSGEIVAASTHDAILIACNDGTSFLRVEELQKPGGKRISVRDFLQSMPLQIGQIFNAT